MWTNTKASNTSQLTPRNRDCDSLLTTVDWRTPGVDFPQLSTLSKSGSGGQMWTLLLFALSLISCAGGLVNFFSSWIIFVFEDFFLS